MYPCLHMHFMHYDGMQCNSLPFATRCVMSVSPRLIGPPPIDLVLGRLGDDTPKHQASSIRISQTTAIIANSINYRTNMSRACNIQHINFHYKTSLSPTLFSLPPQSLKPPAAPVPPTSLPEPSLDFSTLTNAPLLSSCLRQKEQSSR